MRILDHLDILIPIIAVLLWFLSRRREEGEERESDRPNSAPFEVEEDEAEARERTRRIQEEIRRRIAERQREDGGPVAAPPPPAMRSDKPPSPRERVRQMPRPVSEGNLRPPAASRTEVPPIVTMAPDAGAAALAYQQRIAEQWQAIERTRREAERLRKASPYAVVASPLRRGEAEPSGTVGLRSQLMRDLRDPTSLKRAVLLREVLGAPKGLG